MAKAIKVSTESGSVVLKGNDLEAYKVLETYCSNYAINRPIGSSEKPRLIPLSASGPYGLPSSSHMIANYDELRDHIPSTRFSNKEIAKGAIFKVLKDA